MRTTIVFGVDDLFKQTSKRVLTWRDSVTKCIALDTATYEFKLYTDDKILAIVSGKFIGKTLTPYIRSCIIITNDIPTHVVNTSSDERVKLISFNWEE